MYTFSSKLKTFSLILIVLGVLGICYGYFTTPKTIEEVEAILKLQEDAHHGDVAHDVHSGHDSHATHDVSDKEAAKELTKRFERQIKALKRRIVYWPEIPPKGEGDNALDLWQLPDCPYAFS